jgi:hypothetical protein
MQATAPVLYALPMYVGLAGPQQDAHDVQTPSAFAVRQLMCGAQDIHLQIPKDLIQVPAALHICQLQTATMDSDPISYL